MTYIFLDIDGVLKPLSSLGEGLSTRCVGNLSVLVHRLGDVKIILNSAWRIAQVREEFRRLEMFDLDVVLASEQLVNKDQFGLNIFNYCSGLNISLSSVLVIDDELELSYEHLLLGYIKPKPTSGLTLIDIY